MTSCASACSTVAVFVRGSRIGNSSVESSGAPGQLLFKQLWDDAERDGWASFFIGVEDHVAYRIPEEAVDSLQVKLSGLELRRPRVFGNCWMACQVWRELGLENFWQQRLPEGREEVSWEKVLRLLVVNGGSSRAASFECIVTGF